MDIAKRYELMNLNHDKYYDYDSFLTFYNKHDYKDLFFDNMSEYIELLYDLCNKIKFRIYYNMTIHQEEVFIDEMKKSGEEFEKSNYNNTLIQDITRIIDDIKIAKKVSERFYFSKLIKLEDYCIINQYLNDLQIEFSYKNIDFIKIHINDENRMFKSYDPIFNNIIEFINNMKTDKSLMLLDDYFSKKVKKYESYINNYINSFSLDVHDYSIINKAKDIFINHFSKRSVKHKSYINNNINNFLLDLDVHIDSVINKLIEDINPRYNDNIKIFFKMNHLLLYKIFKYFYNKKEESKKTKNIEEDFSRYLINIYKYVPYSQYSQYIIVHDICDLNSFNIDLTGYIFLFNDIEIVQLFFDSLEKFDI